MLIWAFAVVLVLALPGRAIGDVLSQDSEVRAEVVPEGSFIHEWILLDECPDGFWEIEDEEEDGQHPLTAALAKWTEAEPDFFSECTSSVRGRIPIRKKLFLQFCALKIFC